MISGQSWRLRGLKRQAAPRQRRDPGTLLFPAEMAWHSDLPLIPVGGRMWQQKTKLSRRHVSAKVKAARQRDGQLAWLLQAFTTLCGEGWREYEERLCSGSNRTHSEESGGREAHPEFHVWTGVWPLPEANKALHGHSVITRAIEKLEATIE